MSDTTGRDKPQTRRRKSLSDKQLAILEVIQRSIARHGYPPSMREIGDAVGGDVVFARRIEFEFVGFLHHKKMPVCAKLDLPKGNQQQIAGFSQAGMRMVGDDTVEQRPIGRLLDSLQNQGRIGCCIGRAIRAHRFKIACVGHYGCALAQGVKLSSHVCY